MSKRVSLILGDADEQAIEPFIRAGSGQYEVLRQWAARRGDLAVKSEASALRALLQAGVEALRDEVLDAAYAELATTFHGQAERSERRAARDRYAARTDASL
jgi:hypothetical protein